MVQVVVANDEDDWDAERIETAATLDGVVQRANVDGIPVLEEVAEESDVAWLLLLHALDEPVDVVQIVQVVLIGVVARAEVDVSPKNQLANAPEVKRP